MQLIRKSTHKMNRMDRFKNHVLLDFAFTNKHDSYPGKDNTLSVYFYFGDPEYPPSRFATHLRVHEKSGGHEI